MSAPRITDELTELFDNAFANFSQIGEIAGYDLGWHITPVMQPNGQPLLEAHVLIIIAAKNPIVGAPPITGFIDLANPLADQDTINQVVQAMVGQLREVRARLVRGDN